MYKIQELTIKFEFFLVIFCLSFRKFEYFCYNLLTMLIGCFYIDKKILFFCFCKEKYFFLKVGFQ